MKLGQLLARVERDSHLLDDGVRVFRPFGRPFGFPVRPGTQRPSLARDGSAEAGMPGGGFATFASFPSTSRRLTSTNRARVDGS